MNFNDNNLYPANNFYIYYPSNQNKEEYIIYIFFKSPHKNYFTNDDFKEEFKNIINKAQNDSDIYILPTYNSLDDTTKNDDTLYLKILNDIINICSEVMKTNNKIKKQVTIIVRNDLEHNFAKWICNKYSNIPNPPFEIKDFREKKVLNNYDSSESDSGTPLSFGGSGPQISNNLNKPKAKVRIPASSSKHGYTSIWQLILIMIGALIFGIGFAWLLIK